MSDILFMARLTDEGDFVAVNRAERLLKNTDFQWERCKSRSLAE